MPFNWNPQGMRPMPGGGGPPRQNRIRQTRPDLTGGFRPQPGQPGPGGNPPMGKDVYSSPAPPGNQDEGDGPGQGAQTGGNVANAGGFAKYGGQPYMRPISNNEGSGGQHVPIGQPNVDFNPTPMGGGQLSTAIAAPGLGPGGPSFSPQGMGGWFGGPGGGPPGGAAGTYGSGGGVVTGGQPGGSMPPSGTPPAGGAGFGGSAQNEGGYSGGPAPMGEGGGNPLGRRPIGDESRGGGGGMGARPRNSFGNPSGPGGRLSI